MGHDEGYILPNEVIFDKIQETIDLGGTGILMQGGLHPGSEDRMVRRPAALHQGSASTSGAIASPRPRSTNIAEVSGLSLRDTIARLRDAGLDSIPGGGAEILDDEVRHRISRLKCSHRGLDRRAPHRPCARHAHHRHHDVRLRRDASSSA